LVFIPGIGFHHGGANRWIVVGPLNFAPTEIFKLSIIVYLAAWFEKRGSEIKSFLKSTLPFMVILGIAVILIMAQPDLGTMSVVAITSGAMFFVAGASMSHIIAMIGLGVTGFLGLIFTSSYRMSRLMIFLDPSSDPAGKGYQINQALLAIGTGGFWGLGFGQSRQKFNYLPEASTDSIFAVTAEELGFVRASLLVIAFLIFGYQGYKVSEKAPDMFSRLTAVGITTWIVAQAMINVAAMLSIIPLTGVPLPFISYGSSSTWMLMLASGILLNISTHTQGETRESRSLRRRHWWSYFAGFGSN
jgi:cell division protein FtsW